MLQTMKIIWRLGLPLSLTYVIEMAIIMVDSGFAGNISYTSLAAVSLGSNSFYIFLLLVIGVCVACSVKAGQAIGAQDHEAMINCFRQGTLLSLVMGVICALLLLNSASIMVLLGQQAEVIDEMNPYLKWFAWTLPIQALTILYRSYFAVIDTPWACVWPVLCALLLNTFLDYCLSTGQLGFPAMGIEGIGLASLVSNAFLLLMMLRNIGWPTASRFFQFTHDEIWLNNSIWKLVLISLPISITLVAEEAFFAGSAYIAGSLGVQELAAHQILLNAVSTSYLLNMGISTACSILIGKYIGARNFDEILQTVKSGWLSVMLFTLPFALVLIVFGDSWINLFLDEADIGNQVTILLVKSAVVVAVIMLFVDSTWLVVIESLHGMLDTAIPAWCILIAYWLIGLPLALWGIHSLGNSFAWLWTAMLTGSIVMTVLVCLRFSYMIKKLTARQSTEID